MNNEEFRREFQGDPLPNPSIESMADIIHWLWSHWMKYIFDKRLEFPNAIGIFVGDRQFDVKMWFSDFIKWKKQMKTSYFDLPEDEKKSDRDLAKQIFGAHFVYDPFTGEEL